jgi:hypothetical protein
MSGDARAREWPLLPHVFPANHAVRSIAHNGGYLWPSIVHSCALSCEVSGLRNNF